MPELGLFDQPLVVRPRFGPDTFPTGWLNHQVTMPQRHGVDALAAAVQLVGPGDEVDTDVPIAAAVQHWSGEDLGQLDVRSATAQQLARETAPLLRLTDLELHDPSLVNSPGSPLVAVDDTTQLLWTRATRHRVGQRPEIGWMPYGQAVVRWLERDHRQPVAHTMNMTGLGAARSRQAAIEIACAELAAHDAVMTWWLHGTDIPLPRIDEPDEVRAAWDRSPLELRLRALPATTGVPAVLALVIDHNTNIGTLAPAGGTGAVLRATARALWQHAVAHDLSTAAGSLHNPAPPGILDYRDDRMYLNAAGPDLRRAVDPLSSVQLGLDPTVLSRVDQRTREGAPHKPQSPADSFDAILTAGHDIWVVDLTTPDVAAAGWHCVRVVATGMARIPSPAFPLDPSARTAATARHLGWTHRAVEQAPYPGW